MHEDFLDLPVEKSATFAEYFFSMIVTEHLVPRQILEYRALQGLLGHFELFFWRLVGP